MNLWIAQRTLLRQRRKEKAAPQRIETNASDNERDSIPRDRDP